MAQAKTNPITKKKIEAPKTPLSVAAQQSMRNFLIIFIGVTTLIVLVGGYFIYNLARANVTKALEVRAQEYQIKLTEKKIDDLKEAEPRLAEIKKAENGGVSKFDFVTQRSLPATDDFEGILTIFNRLQAEQGVAVDSIARVSAQGASTTGGSTAPQAAGGASQQSQVSIKVTAGRESMLRFLRAVESSARIFDFTSMKLSGGTTDLTLDMQYRVYNLPKPSIEDQKVKIDEYEKDKGKYE